jgi:hypothetical protein
VLVAGAGGAAAAAARADETEQRMVVRKRRNAPGPAPTGARVNGARRDEAPSTSANARKVASLNQAPDGRTRDAKGTPRLLNGDHRSCHAPIVSQSSHRPNRLVRTGRLRRTAAYLTGRLLIIDGIETTTGSIACWVGIPVDGNQ